MTTEQAKESLAALHAELEEVESQTPEEEKVANETYDATGLALAMANDHGVDLGEVTGTGKDGRITVPDVDKFIKARDAEIAEVEAKAEADAEVIEAAEPEAKAEVSDKANSDDEPAEAPPKPRKKRRKKAGRQSVPFASALPLHTSYAEVRHFKRTLNEFGFPWDEGEVVTREEADEALGKLLQEGFVPIHIEGLGLELGGGIEMLWVLGLPEEDETPRYQEIYHVVRNVGTMGPDGRGVSGVGANELVTSYLDDGWDLAYIGVIAKTGAGLNLMWVFVR